MHTAKRLARESGGVMRIPTFGIIIIQVRRGAAGCMQPGWLGWCNRCTDVAETAVALALLQGIVGSVPYASLIFLTLYFQVRPAVSACWLARWISTCKPAGHVAAWRGA